MLKKTIVLNITMIIGAACATTSDLHAAETPKSIHPFMPVQRLNPARFPHLRGPDVAGQYVIVKQQSTPAPTETEPTQHELYQQLGKKIQETECKQQ